ncbi:MAG: type II secretion system F family protein [Planctomycetes bacterium]|nr:type II secretion system F family protein [Planctomycetota bacterium]
MNPETLASLSDEMAALARAGLPLDRGLAALSRELGGDSVGRACGELARLLSEGQPPDTAITKALKGVPPHVAALVRAGITSGKLAESLSRLGEHTRLRSRLTALVIDALFYPCIVLVFGLAIFAFLGIFVIPKFMTIFADFGMRTPWLTRVFFALNEHAVVFYLVIPASLVLALTGVRFLMRATEKGRLAWTRATGMIPIWGMMQRQVNLSLLYDLLGLLVTAEVPLPQALRLAGEASPDPVLRGAAAGAAADLEAGKPLEPSLRDHQLGTAWAAWIAGVGASQGKLASQLELLRDTSMRLAEWRARWLRAILPPVLLVLVAGGGIGMFIFSLFLPMFTLMEGLSQ